ncbi:MAG: phosphotransferase, partial [Nocardiopsaceae bacterium]|nr:phosphotransferase [Nocardiopsaceae bacterium]
PAPRLRHARDTGWIVLVFDHVDNRHADLSPGSPDLPSVVNLVRAVGALPARADTPDVAGYVAELQVKTARLLVSHPDGELQRVIAAATGAFDLRELAGPQLVHYDLHSGNLLVTADGTVAVDWSFACKGAAWIDAALLVPRLIAAGHSPADAELVVSALPAWRSAPRAAVTGLAAYWTAFRAYKAIYGPEPARETRTRAARAGQAWVQHRMSTRAGA